jgi:hypothetical protein
MTWSSMRLLDLGAALTLTKAQTKRLIVRYVN